MSDAGVGGRRDFGPYPGVAQFEVEDASLFFGRGDDAQRLVATILSSRFTLVHSQSGVGKTSLINARVIPTLENAGWTPVRVLVQNDPTEAVRATTLQYVLPPPAYEVRALDRAAERLALAPSATISELLAAYRAMAIDDAERRALITPYELPERTDGLPSPGPVTPFVVRLLRCSVSPQRFAEHVHALSSPERRIGPDTTLDALRDVLASSQAADTHAEIVAQLGEAGRRGLLPFFEHLFALWGTRHRNLGVVLLLDQFEELFTRFVDRGAGGARPGDADWRLRPRFLSELERLYGMPERGRAYGNLTPNAITLPIRFVVSLRDEFVAQLDDVQRFVPDLGDSTVHLRWLTVQQAVEAICQPAAQFGYSYSTRCLARIRKELRRERRYVEPTPLQLVCDRLWRERGRALVAAGPAPHAPGRLPTVELGDYTQLKGARGVLSDYVHQVFDALSEADRLEVVEMLEPLITTTNGVHTRNVALWDQLVVAPFRNAAHRAELLQRLVNHRLLRAERRLAGRLVEITHEFLIGAIKDVLTDEATRPGNNARFREALEMLRQFEDREFRIGTTNLLSRDELLALHENRRRIAWPRWATDLMFRSAVVHGADRWLVRVWARRLRLSTAARAPADPRADLLAGRRRTTLSASELARLRAAVDRGAIALDRRELRLALRSALHRNAHGDDIRYWAHALTHNDANKHG